MIGRRRRRRSIRGLTRVSQKDDKSDGRVSQETKVKVTIGKFVDFVNDEDRCVFEESGFPGGYSPRFRRGQIEGFLPMASEFYRGNTNAKFTRKG